MHQTYGPMSYVPSELHRLQACPEPFGRISHFRFLERLKYRRRIVSVTLIRRRRFQKVIRRKIDSEEHELKFVN